MRSLQTTSLIEVISPHVQKHLLKYNSLHHHSPRGQESNSQRDAESQCEYENTLAHHGVRTYAELLPVSLARALDGGELDVPMKAPTVGLEPTSTRLRALRSAD